MRSPSRVRAGHRSLLEGKQFESLLELQARMQGILPIKIPTGARYLSMHKKWIPVKSPFDYILIHNGNAAFIDCKTVSTDFINVQQGNMELIKSHQIQILQDIEYHKCRAGFLIWFRKSDSVVFFDSSKVAQEKLTPLKGEYLGNFESIALGNLFL